MYIGDTGDGSGLLHLVWELVANALDQFLLGHCTRIDVTLGADGAITVADDGAGIPVEDVDGTPFLERIFTLFHTTPTADGHAPHEHLTRHGVGVMPVNAVSSRLTVHTHRGGALHSQTYERGVALAPLQHHGPCAGRGTVVSLLPDPEIFADTRIDAGILGARLRELSWLHPPLQLTLIDQRVQVFHAPGGLDGYLRHLCGHSTAAIGPLHIAGTEHEIQVTVAAAWLPNCFEKIESFANSERTTEHGTHVKGLRRALVRAVRDAFPEQCRKLPGAEISRRISRGLHAVVCVQLFDPKYGHPTRDQLTTPQARQAVCAVTEPALQSLIASNAQLRAYLLAALVPDRT